VATLVSMHTHAMELLRKLPPCVRAIGAAHQDLVQRSACLLSARSCSSPAHLQLPSAASDMHLRAAADWWAGGASDTHRVWRALANHAHPGQREAPSGVPSEKVRIEDEPKQLLFLLITVSAAS
jgi:hypothetical protein